MNKAGKRSAASAPKVLLQELDYSFTDHNLLQQALTHRSCGPLHNERLEFLGDAVLNCIITTALYRQCSLADEGELSRLRAHLVRESTLAEVGRRLALGEHLCFGPGENHSGSWRRASVVADALEALIGAVFLDGGMDGARTVVLSLFAGHLQTLPSAESLKDPKTRLQEYLQARSLPLPEYHLQDTSGPQHRQRFSVQVCVQGLVLSGTGEGRSRRRAEQGAARQLLDLLQETHEAGA